MSLEQHLKNTIVDVPDFPIEGILFKDITPILSDPESLRMVIDALVDHYKDMNVSRFVGIESRGFIFGTALAYAMNKGFVLVRKPGKLPRDTVSVSYDLEYGQDTLEIHGDDLKKGERVVVIDDLLATGGTANAACELVEKVGGKVVECAFIIELSFLEGRKLLSGRKIHSIVTY
jgi:adenine phosphoribosyltransferase